MSDMLPGFDIEPTDGSMVAAAQAHIAKLRETNTLQPWHELDCAIVVELARSTAAAHGVAKAHMFNAFQAAKDKLPTPVIAETDEGVVQTEAERIAAYLAAHALADSADVSDETVAA